MANGGSADGAVAKVISLPHLLVEKPWGRCDLPGWIGAVAEPIGEVWFDRAGQPLPVLVKWLFTSERLSIQVHPNDAQARERGQSSGKEECWIVTHAEPDAVLGIGTRTALTSEQLREASLSGEIEGMMEWKPVKAGDWFYIPAGTVHAVGAGVTLVEVQQNSDITYRLYDYGRPRELHLDDGIAVSRPSPYRGPSGSLDFGVPVQPVASGPNFTIHALHGGAAPMAVAGSDCLLIPLEGEIACGSVTARVGDVLLATGGRTEVTGQGARLLAVAIA